MTFELPIFPLNTVLFPGGLLPLKIFEQRYLEMASACLKASKPFGVCLIAEGAEVGAPALPHAVGTVAHIGEWDMQQLGVLNVTVTGGSRFRIVERSADAHGLVRAVVEGIPDEPPLPLPPSLQGLVPLMKEIVSELGTARVAEPHRFDDAVWLGYRYCEVLPIPLQARQRLLELDDSVSRLEIIRQFLKQRGLVQ